MAISSSTRQLLAERAQQAGVSVDQLLRQYLQADEGLGWRIIHHLPAELIVADAKQHDFPIIYVNHEFEAITGYQHDEVIGRNARFLQGNDVQQPGLETVRAALREQTACSVVLRNYRKDGSLFFNELHLAPVVDARGQATHILGIQHDVTGRVEAEQALIQVNGLLQSILDSVSYVIAVINLPDGDVAFVSQSAEQLYGVPLSTLQQQRWLRGEYLHPDDREWIRSSSQQILEKGLMEWSYRIIQPDGQVRWVHERSWVVYDVAHQPIRITSVIRDISEEKRSETQQHIQLRALEAAANAIVITDRNATIEWVNPAFSQLTGYSYEEAVGHNPRDLVRSGVHDTSFYKSMWDTLLAGQVWSGKLINRRKDGSLYSEEQTITPVQDSRGEIIRFVAIKQDVTQREIAEKLALDQERLRANLKKEQEYNALIQKVIASLAHDIRTPLAAIATSRDLLSRYFDRMDSEQRQSKLEAIGAQLQFVTKLLNDVTMVLDNNLENRPLKLEVINLEALCQVAVQEMQPLVTPGHNLQFSTDGVVQYALVDEVLVSRILLNLLSNAIKYSPDGGEIRLELSAQDRQILFSVIDQGIGMAEADLSRIFEPFYRVKTNRQIAGTGLGLSIVQECVAHHRGEIQVHSQIGKGSTFRVILPKLAQSADRPPMGQPSF